MTTDDEDSIIRVIVGFVKETAGLRVPDLWVQQARRVQAEAATAAAAGAWVIESVLESWDLTALGYHCQGMEGTMNLGVSDHQIPTRTLHPSHHATTTTDRPLASGCKCVSSSSSCIMAYGVSTRLHTCPTGPHTGWVPSADEVLWSYSTDV